MNIKDYVSHKVARLLKELGFDWACSSVWNLFPEGEEEFVEDYHATFHGFPTNFNNSNVYGLGVCSAPTLWQAQKWLRDVKHISIRVSYLQEDSRWFSDWLNIETGEFDDWDESYSTYEEALDAGIKSVLEMIKDK